VLVLKERILEKFPGLERENSPEVPTAPVFRQEPPQSQTPPVERPQPSRSDSGATRQADMAELLDHVSQEMTKLYPLIADLHTASLGNILTLAPGISDLMRPQFLLRSQGAFCARKTIGLFSQAWTQSRPPS